MKPLEASQLQHGIPDLAPAGLKRILKGLDGWDLMYSTAKVLIDAEYYADPKRAGEVKTPEHVEVILNCGAVREDRERWVEFTCSGVEGKALSFKLGILKGKDLETVVARNQKEVVEWLETNF